MFASVAVASCERPPAEQQRALQNHEARVPTGDWKKLNDGSWVATYRTELDEPGTKRCWKANQTFDCLVVTGDEKAPSGWWAWRVQSPELTTAFDLPDNYEGYNCYGGGTRNPGVTIGEVIGTLGHNIANQYVQPPAHKAWTREYIEATVGPTGQNSYFDCPALDRFITAHGVEALQSNRRLPFLIEVPHESEPSRS